MLNEYTQIIEKRNDTKNTKMGAVGFFNFVFFVQIRFSHIS